MKQPNWIQDADEFEADILIVKASGEMARTKYPGQYRRGPSKSGKPGTVGIYFYDFSREPLPNRGKCESTRDPIFILMQRTVTCGDPSCEEENPQVERCHVCKDKCIRDRPMGVFLSRKEGEDYGNQHGPGHRNDEPGKFPRMTGTCWYVYCIPAEGSLATLLDEHARRED